MHVAVRETTRITKTGTVVVGAAGGTVIAMDVIATCIFVFSDSRKKRRTSRGDASPTPRMTQKDYDDLDTLLQKIVDNPDAR